MNINAVRLGVAGVLALAGVVAGCGGGSPAAPAAAPGLGSSSSSSSSASQSSSSSLSSSSSAPPPASTTDHVTYRHDTARTGLNASETILTPANVNVSSFGLLGRLQVDGKVDAQPLYLSRLGIGGTPHNVVFVATENDSVYAFDADSGAQLWHVSVAGPGEGPGDGGGCNQVVPTIGVTATPVIDRKAGEHGEIFVVAMTKDAGGVSHHRLHALDLTTGAEVAGSPAEITGSYPSAGGGSSFDARQYEERSALLLSGGVIYTTWTSHCDTQPYGGWIMAYSETSLLQTGALNIAASSTAGPAIWMAGNGPSADSDGNLYLLTANGAFDTVLDGNGFPAGGDYGNSFLKIATGGGLTVADYFASSNTGALSSADLDLGSGGQVLLPDVTDETGRVRHLVVGAGKEGTIYLLDRDAMGRFNVASNNVYQQLPGALAQVYSTPAYFNDALYYCDVGSTCKSFSLGNGRLAATPSSHADKNFTYPGSSPAVSADGTANGILWAHENGEVGVLHAYDAANLAVELYNSSQADDARDQLGPGNKFITPVIADGRVFVGTQNSVAVYGLLPH